MTAVNSALIPVTRFDSEYWAALPDLKGTTCNNRHLIHIQQQPLGNVRISNSFTRSGALQHNMASGKAPECVKLLLMCTFPRGCCCMRKDNWHSPSMVVAKGVARSHKKLLAHGRNVWACAHELHKRI